VRTGSPSSPHGAGAHAAVARGAEDLRRPQEEQEEEEEGEEEKEEEEEEED